MKRFIVMLLVLPMGSMSKAEAASGEKGAGQVVEGNSEFALDLYARLRQRPGNLFLSPYSISTALAMTYAGAQGETAAEMAKTLHFRLESDRLHAAFAALIRQTDEKQGQLFVANALWGQKGDHFLPDFLKRTRDQYGAGLNEVDFRAETEKARQTINAWVEERTGHKISNLLKPPLPSSDTSLVLTNAIYFKGYWSSPFPKPATTEADFRIAADQPVRVPMMQQTGRFPYLDDGTFQALELPYEGKAFSMVVLLPKRLDGLGELERTLTATKLSAAVSRLAPHRVVVGLPKFQLSAGFELKAVLSALGMPLAFTPGSADFSGMDGTRDLYLSAVVHEAVVEVDEEGTEAAAATAVVGIRLAARPEPPVTFRADHPFLFLIRDVRTGSILFLGRVANPRP